MCQQNGMSSTLQATSLDVCCTTAGDEGPCIIYSYHSPAAVKAGVEALLQQQQRGVVELLHDAKKREESHRALSFIGQQPAHLPTGCAVGDAVMALTPERCAIPELEARKLLHGTSVVPSSAADDAELLDHLQSLRPALSADDARRGNRYTGLKDKVTLVTPVTSGLLDGVAFHDTQGQAGLQWREGCHAIVYMVDQVKRGQLMPFTNSIAHSAVIAHWIDDFTLLKARRSAGGQAEGGASQRGQPFSFPMLALVLTADKVFARDIDDVVRLPAEQQAECLQELQKTGQEALDFIAAEVAQGLARAGEGALTQDDVQEIVERQLVLTCNWSSLRRKLDDGQEQHLAPLTEDVLKELCCKLKVAKAAAEEVEQRVLDRGVVAVAEEVDTHIKATLSLSRSAEPPEAHQALGTPVLERSVMTEGSRMCPLVLCILA
jgi:hypothetical protein